VRQDVCVPQRNHLIQTMRNTGGPQCPKWAIWLLVMISLAYPALPDDLAQRAIVQIAEVDDAIKIERSLDANSDRDPPDNGAWYQVLRGGIPIIVSAPHATMPFREGAFRFSDGGGTGALAMELHVLANVYVIYTQFRSPSDPNFYDDNDYKRALEQLLKETGAWLVLDIHGSSPKRPYDVDLGTMNGESLNGEGKLPEQLQRVLRHNGISAISTNYFSASKNQTVTRFVAERRIPAIQLEINSTWLQPAETDLGAHRFAQVLEALTEFVQMEQQKHRGSVDH
jgi:hypothetical protein